MSTKNDFRKLNTHNVLLIKSDNKKNLEQLHFKSIEDIVIVQPLKVTKIIDLRDFHASITARP